MVARSISRELEILVESPPRLAPVTTPGDSCADNAITEELHPRRAEQDLGTAGRAPDCVSRALDPDSILQQAPVARSVACNSAPERLGFRVRASIRGDHQSAGSLGPRLRDDRVPFARRACGS